MGEFTITQTRTGNNLYIYPDGDLTGCTDWSTFGDAPNWKCVDEDRHNPDDDTTYVYNVTDSKVDLYTLPNQSVTGTINYVQVYSRAKSNEYTQAQTGVYHILVAPAGVCTDYYESDDINLVTSYKTYNNVWTENPKTSVAWVWADIDLLCIGQRATSPEYGTEKTLTLRPNAVGTQTQLTAFGVANNWDCVNETTPDDDTTYVYMSGSGGYLYDTYNCPNHTTENGSINKVVLYSYSKTITSGGGIRSRMYISGNGYTAAPPFVYSTTGNYVYYAWSYINSSDTGIAWTWGEIDSLEIGIGHQTDLPGGEGRTTQNYAIVYYTQFSSPQIRCTQSYCRVNYDTSATCTVDKPETISTNHARNVKMLNFWSGDREVYDLNRSGKSMVMNGIFYENACTDLSCLRDMALNGNTITISNLGQTCYEGDYRIRSVGWEEISKTPEVFRWILELEAAD